MRQFYRELFKEAELVEVHKAKERGKLLVYAKRRCRDMDDRVRDVLQKIDSTTVNAKMDTLGTNNGAKWE